MKKIFTLLCLFMAFTAAWADDYDFVEGGIAYKKLTASTVAVAQYEDSNHDSYYTGNITIPATVTNGGVTYNVTEIDEEAFGQSSITGITLPEGIVKIGSDAFEYCEYLTSITLPESIERICENAFECTSLTTITLPKNVKYLCNDDEDKLFNDVFYECEKIKEVKVAADNATYADIDGVLVTKDKKTLLYYPAAKATPTVPEGIEVISKNAFHKIALNSINIPSSVKEISKGAFGSCATLSTITLPEGLITIGESAFSGTALTSVTIPASTTSIDNNAFAYCENLKNIYTLATTPQKIGEETFPTHHEWDNATQAEKVSYPFTLHVLPGCKAAYQAADVWKEFTIVEDAVATSIATAKTQAAGTVEIYTINGIRTNGHKGLNIIRQADGTAKKIMVK